MTYVNSDQTNQSANKYTKKKENQAHKHATKDCQSLRRENTTY